MEFDREALLRQFRDEVEDLLSEMERCALHLDDVDADLAPVEELFRCAHTLKGSASCVGHARLTALAHEVEGLFEAVTTRRRAPDAELTALSLVVVDALGRCARSTSFEEAELTSAERGLVQRIGLWLAAGEAGSALPLVPERTPEVAYGKRSLRVEVERLDKLLNLVGEVAVAQGRMSAAVTGGQQDVVRSSLEDFQGLFHALQEHVLRLRLVPLAPMFERFRRAARELSLSAGKLTEFVIEGGDVEVDVALVDALRDPLTHMLRNAIDHGIEPAEERRNRGKPALGRITLRARNDGNFVVVEVADDGAGIDSARLIERAAALGLASNATDTAAIHELAFAPGLSTSKEVGRLSGRGIGMDVVRRNIEGMRGSVTLDSRPGLGVTVSIRVPLTVAVIQGFAVGVGDEVYIVPLDAVRECIDRDQESTVVSRVGGLTELHGRPLPFIDLGQQLRAPGGESARRSIVVLEHGSQRAGLEVDRLIGEVQTVIKPLGPLFKNVQQVASAAIQEDGSVALVLDVGSLLRSVGGETRAGLASPSL